jgi:hypothetical protein
MSNERRKWWAGGLDRKIREDGTRTGQVGLGSPRLQTAVWVRWNIGGPYRPKYRLREVCLILFGRGIPVLPNWLSSRLVHAQ